MSQTTYLDYTCAPNPLTEGAIQDIVIIATLKSESELGVSLTSATIDQVVLDFGTIGSGATQLTETAFNVDDIEVPHHWKLTVSGATCTLTPEANYREVSSQALIFKLKNVNTNNTAGNVTLAIKEAATPSPQTNEVPPTTTPQSPGIEDIILPKVAVNGVGISFSAQPANTIAGGGTTLSWSGGKSTDTYTLLYLKEGNLQPIASHTNHSAFAADDVYPNLDLSPPDSLLVLNSTTTFVLKIEKSGGATEYKTTTVLVSQPNISANDLTATGTVAAPTVNVTGNGLNLKGQMTIGDALGNGVVYLSQKNQSGFYFRTGNPASYTDLATLDSQGNLQVNGAIAATKTIQSNGTYITNETVKSAGGWKGGTATYTTGNTESTGGTTIGSIAGFSLTNGGGNYGYYAIDLGGVVEGILTVDMYITNNSGPGTGFWHIISATSPIGSDNKFSDITKTYQVWSEYQNPAQGFIYNNGQVIRKKVSTYFYGQYIYIGSTDLGQGQLGIKINNVTATPLF